MIINQLNTDSKINQGGVSSVVAQLYDDLTLQGKFECHLNPSFYKLLFPQKNTLNHLHGIWHQRIIFLYMINLIFGIPYVVTVHGMLNPWALRQKKMKKSFFMPILKVVLSRAAAIVVNTEAEKKIVRRLMPKARINVIENYVNIPRRQNKMDTSSKLLVYVGRFHPTKNLENLIMAVRNLDVDLKLHGYGESEYTLKLHRLSRQFDNIEICAPIYGQEKFDLLRRAAGVVLPSVNEGFPMLALECWSVCGLLIMNKNSNLDHAFEAGAALDCGESELELRKFFQYFLGISEQKRIVTREIGYKFASEQYSKQAVLEKYNRMFLEIIKDH